MSSYNTSGQNGIGRIEDEQRVSREELAIRLKLEELKRAQLRRRLNRLETKVNVEPEGFTEKMEQIQNGLLQDLDELDGKEVDDE